MVRLAYVPPGKVLWLPRAMNTLSEDLWPLPTVWDAFTAGLTLTRKPVSCQLLPYPPDLFPTEWINYPASWVRPSTTVFAALMLSSPSSQPQNPRTICSSTRDLQALLNVCCLFLPPCPRSVWEYYSADTWLTPLGELRFRLSPFAPVSHGPLFVPPVYFPCLCALH